MRIFIPGPQPPTPGERAWRVLRFAALGVAAMVAGAAVVVLGALIGTGVLAWGLLGEHVVSAAFGG